MVNGKSDKSQKCDRFTLHPVGVHEAHNHEETSLEEETLYRKKVLLYGKLWLDIRD